MVPAPQGRQLRITKGDRGWRVVCYPRSFEQRMIAERCGMVPETYEDERFGPLTAWATPALPSWRHAIAVAAYLVERGKRWQRNR